MTKRVEHNLDEKLMKSKVPCLIKFVAVVAIVFNSFVIQGAQNSFPLTIDNNGILNTPGINNPFRIGIQNYKGFDFPFWRDRLYTNGSGDFLCLGDSMMETRLYTPISKYITDTLGYNGAKTPGDIGISWRPFYVLNGGSYITNSDYPRWMSAYYVLPPGSSLTINEQVGPLNPNLYGNLLEMDCIGEAGAGTAIFRTNFNSAGWVSMITNSTDTGGSPTGVVIRVTNAVASLLQIMATNSSAGTVRIVSMSIVDKTHSGGSIPMNIAQGGRSLAQFMQSSNVSGPIIRSWNPALVIQKWADDDLGGLTDYRQALTQFNGYARKWLTNSSFLDITCNDLSSSPSQHADIIAQNTATFTNGIAQDHMIFDEYALFGTYSNGLVHGYFVPADPHPTTLGNYYSASVMMNWADLFHIAGNYIGGVTLFSPSYNGNFRTNTVLRTTDGVGRSGAGWNWFGATPAAASAYQVQGILNVNYDNNVSAPGVNGYAATLNGGARLEYGIAGQNNGLVIQYGNVIVGSALSSGIPSGCLGVDGGFITNAQGPIWFSTNGTPTLALPNGSICTVTDGRFYVRTNSTWVQK